MKGKGQRKEEKKTRISVASGLFKFVSLCFLLCEQN